MTTIEEFLDGRCNMNRINRAYIVLIPKVQGAEYIGDFQPFSLSNFIYLIIAKVLANRLRGVLTSLKPLPICIYAGSADVGQHRASGGDCGSVTAEGHPGVYVEGGFF